MVTIVSVLFLWCTQTHFIEEIFHENLLPLINNNKQKISKKLKKNINSIRFSIALYVCLCFLIPTRRLYTVVLYKFFLTLLLLPIRIGLTCFRLHVLTRELATLHNSTNQIWVDWCNAENLNSFFFLSIKYLIIFFCFFV